MDVNKFELSKCLITRPPLSETGTFLPVLPLPDRLFKYTRRIFFDQFLIRGEIRLGTLFGYQDIETFGISIGDDQEGHRYLWPEHPEIDVPMYTAMIALNSWIYCMTSLLDDRLFKEFDADCVFEITSPEFFHAIARTLFPECSLGLLVAVRYPSDEQISENIAAQSNRAARAKHLELPRAAETKRPEYAHQSEVRAMWEPHSVRGALAPDGLSQAFSREDQDLYWRDRRAFLKSQTYLRPDLRARNIRIPEARSFVQLIH